VTRAPRCTFDTVLPVVQALQCTADDKLMWITAVPHSRFGEYAGMGLLAHYDHVHPQHYLPFSLVYVAPSPFTFTSFMA
jgi:hypothetical protein